MKALDVDIEQSLPFKLGEEKGEMRGEMRGEARGRLDEARNVVLELGTLRFGEPDAATKAAVEAIADLARLIILRHKLLTAADWAELLAGE